MSARFLLVLLVLLGAWQAAAVAPAILPPRVEWTRRLEALPEDAPTALARGGGGELAVGGARSVRVVDSAGVPETRLRRGPVVDLAFAVDGTLWVATPGELYRVAPDGSRERELLSTGEERRVVRIAAARGHLAAATDRGVELRGRDARWQRLRVLPSSPASLVAFRLRGAALELWSVIDGELWIAELPPSVSPSGPAWRLAERVRLPVSERDEGAVDLAFDLPGADAVLVFPTLLLLRDGAGTWSSVRPALPPGARASRLARAFDRLWLATDAGLLSAGGLEGPWRRASPPLGSLPAVGLLGGETLHVATRRGVDAGVSREPVQRPTAQRAPRDEAPGHHLRAVARLHRAALREQGLRPASQLGLRERVRLRGWWPEVDVGFAYEDGRFDRDDYDQSFVSGGMRHLYDRASDRERDYEVGIALSWDLGDIAFHPEEVDVSRESRSLVALRDDVLDEVTGLYFERLAVLARVDAAPPAERPALVRRAAELAAGLDAWTGGAFSANADAENSLPAVPRGG
ncbi:MAG: hypothetical protein ACQGVC_14485 [Myxococcota bacterium]